jgi:hypothetical protein
MLRSPRKEVELNVSSCKLINDGAPFLRVTCETISVTPEQREFILQNKSWYLDGAGGPIKAKDMPQFLQRHHMPSPTRGNVVVTASGAERDGIHLDESGFSTGVGHFTMDLVVDLYMPMGALDIHFARYNDEMEMLRRAREAEAEQQRKAQEAAEKAKEKARKKAERESAVDAFRRRFDNLDLEGHE